MPLRTTIELTEEQRRFLDRLPHGSIKVLVSALLDCAIELGDIHGERTASAFIQSGITNLTIVSRRGNG